MTLRFLMILIIMTTDTTAGQAQTDASVNYIHSGAVSFKSQFLQKLMGILGKKNAMERNIRAGKFSSEAVTPPKVLLSNFKPEVTEVGQRKVWTFRRVPQRSQKVILYIHGGGYISNLTKYDWAFIQELLVKTNCSIIVPDYPLVPHSNYTDVYFFFDELYSILISKTSQENIIFMGNSAGGGIALGFAQKLRNENKPQPSQIILNSPWLDITMSNPDIIEIDKKDNLLGINGLKMAGQAYAADLYEKDYRVSPLYGDFSELGQISLFIGTHDLFLADSRKLKERMKKQNIPINYFEYPKMFHVWIALTNLKESQHAINQIATLVNR
jgi:acetyl esterase/lipase